jgi:preprotein translocase subunit Sss1
MDFWIVICCSAAAGILFLGLVGVLILLLFRETSRNKQIDEE